MNSKQILDVQQMQHLQELGLELKETMMYWTNNHKEKQDWYMTRNPVGRLFADECLPAYTLQDVLDALPKDISKDGCTWYASLYIDFENNRIAYGNTDRYGFEIYHEIMIEKYLIDAAYSMLCWCIEQGYVDTNKNERSMKNYKVLFADLDGTLIETASGNTFPKGIWDMRIRFDVLDAIRKLKPLCLMIVTNQGGIEKGFVNRRNFEFKMEYIIRSIKEYVGCYTEYSYCESNDKTNHYRKPNTGMLESMMTRILKHLFRLDNLTKDDCLMIGDASGKEGQFSDSDKKTAENFGIDYMDVDDFIKQMSYERDTEEKD